MRVGGVQQRKRKREQEEQAAGVGTSLLALHLASEFSWGSYSPQQVQKLASLTLQDFKKVARPEDIPEDLVKLAGIGSSGRYPSKCHEDLMKLVEPRVKLPQPTVANLPFKAPINEQPQAMFLPHETFASLYNDFGEGWMKSMVPDASEIPVFWGSVANHPGIRDHPMKAKGDFRNKCIPVGMHGDDVPCTGLGKCWVSKQTEFSWFSMLATAQSTQDRMFWIYGCMEKFKVAETGVHTMHTFFTILAWSFLWLSRGQWPDADWNGKKRLRIPFSFSNM